MNFEIELIQALKDKGVSDTLISDIINSGYIIREWGDLQGGSYTSVSDKLYGSKGTSNNFELDKFIAYAKGESADFGNFPFISYHVKSYADINEILNDERRKRLIDSGRMVFRGQPQEYYYTRKIPNPIRRDNLGREISITPGIYRGFDLGISNNRFKTSNDITNRLLASIESINNPELNSYYSYDFTRVHQHYISHTEGLDVTFDIRTAIYFATNRLHLKDERIATYENVELGSHTGVIYGIVFRDPSVTKSEFYIDQFDYFKCYTPERILRQHCGLPIFHEYERNIAITDIDFIIYLEPEFEFSDGFTYKYMFPDRAQDKFYDQLLKLKQKFPEHLQEIVEYI